MKNITWPYSNDLVDSHTFILAWDYPGWMHCVDIIINNNNKRPLTPKSMPIIISKLITIILVFVWVYDVRVSTCSTTTSLTMFWPAWPESVILNGGPLIQSSSIVTQTYTSLYSLKLYIHFQVLQKSLSRCLGPGECLHSSPSKVASAKMSMETRHGMGAYQWMGRDP